MNGYEILPTAAVGGVKCPGCADKGKNTWVLPGKKCGECGETVSGAKSNDKKTLLSLNNIFLLVLIVVALLVYFTVLNNQLTGYEILPIPGIKCPKCLEKGKTVWVIPGKNCRECGHPCDRTAHVPGLESIITKPILKKLTNYIGNILPCVIVIGIGTVGIILGCYGHGINVEYTGQILTCFNSIVTCDAPRPWGVYFQDVATPQMEALVELHDTIMFYLIAILFAVGWTIWALLRRSAKSELSGKYISHGAFVELVWTVTPGIMLLLIAFTSFKLLYLMDEVSDTDMTLYIEGHQWYWSYQYPDFLGDDGDFIEYDSYLIPESDLEDGALRMLDVDERVIIPEVTHTRFIVSSGDVIHSYACPSLGIKCDAYPGRLNQASALINRLGTFYGQCSEICGILHSSMPICIQCVSLEKFLLFLWEK